jgi:hypothetical protein
MGWYMGDMAISVPDESQQKAARVAGFSYLVALLFANFAEFYVAAHIVVYNDAATTAQNVMAHELLFRLGIAGNLIVFALDVVLIIALYVILKPVNRNLALIAACWRLIETATMVVVALSDLDVLRLLSGAEYLRVFEADRLQALARLSIGAHGAAYSIGLLFFGLGSTLFGYLWIKSNYVPKALAAWGLLSSVLVLITAFALVVFPEIAKRVIPGCYVPIFVFELIMGFWLLFKGLRPAIMVAD